MTTRTYRLVRPLARSASAQVWEAEVIATGRPVIVKRLETSDRAALRAYRTEHAALALLSHPNVIALVDHGEVDGSLYIVTERIEGLDVGRALRSGDALAAPMAFCILQDVASALAHAHAPRPGTPSGIAHRDVRPENVLLDRRGIARVLDFGLAHGIAGREATASDVVRGTPGFVAPETVLGVIAGPPADVWALGALLHALLVGHPPVRTFAQAHAVAHGAPLSLDPALVGTARTLVERCLATAPHERPSAAEVAAEARAFVGAAEAQVRIALGAWARGLVAREPARGALDDLLLVAIEHDPARTLVLGEP